MKPRTHYNAEIEDLLRIRRVVELDARPAWRDEVTGHIDSLVAVLARKPALDPATPPAARDAAWYAKHDSQDEHG